MVVVALLAVSVDACPGQRFDSRRLSHTHDASCRSRGGRHGRGLARKSRTDTGALRRHVSVTVPVKFMKLCTYIYVPSGVPLPRTLSSERCWHACKRPTRWFWREGSLNKLTRAHLVRLVKACNTVPPFKKATANFAPTSWLVTWLQNEASSLR